jgi:hypothetical protein
LKSRCSEIEGVLKFDVAFVGLLLCVGNAWREILFPYQRILGILATFDIDLYAPLIDFASTSLLS